MYCDCVNGFLHCFSLHVHVLLLSECEDSLHKDATGTYLVNILVMEECSSYSCWKFLVTVLKCFLYLTYCKMPWEMLPMSSHCLWDVLLGCVNGVWCTCTSDSALLPCVAVMLRLFMGHNQFLIFGKPWQLVVFTTWWESRDYTGIIFSVYSMSVAIATLYMYLCYTVLVYVSHPYNTCTACKTG